MAVSALDAPGAGEALPWDLHAATGGGLPGLPAVDEDPVAGTQNDADLEHWGHNGVDGVIWVYGELFKGQVFCRNVSYIYICIYLFIQIYIHTHVCTHMHLYIYIYIYTCMYIYVYICIYISVYISVFIYIYVCICIYIYMCIYIYICIYVYRYIYIYVLLVIYMFDIWISLEDF